MSLRKIVLSIFIVLLVSGCKSTPASKDNITEASSIPTNSKILQEVKPSLTFKKEPTVSNLALRNIDSQFDTLSIQEFHLKEHQLHKIVFNSSVLFESDQSDLGLINVDELTQFAEAYVSKSVGKHIYILGNTDSKGTQIYNQSLSVRRALIVASLLVKSGVTEELIKLVPAGETIPIATNKTTAGRAENRRVEILTAESRELVKAFLRELDCEKVDEACTRALLPIFDVKVEKGEIFVHDGFRDVVVTQSPEMNDLRTLANDLALDLEETDRRFATKDERTRMNLAMPAVRQPFFVETTVRSLLDVGTSVRSLLLLPAKYYLENNE